jgi:hypothetical protein
MLKAIDDKTRDGVGVTINDKLDVILEGVKLQIFRDEISIILSLMGWGGIIVLFACAVGLRSAAFININEYSKNLVKDCHAKLNLIQASVTLALFVGIIAGVIASGVYDQIKNLL